MRPSGALCSVHTLFFSLLLSLLVVEGVLGVVVGRAGEGAPGMAMLAGEALLEVGPGVVAGELDCAAAGELLVGGVLSWGPAEMTAPLPSPEGG